MLAKHFDPDQVGSVQQQILSMVRKVMKEHQREVARGLLEESGPLGILRADLTARISAVLHGNDALTNQLATLQERLAVKEARDEAKENGAAKGVEYEEVVAAAVESIHAPLEDLVQRVGSELGVTGRRTGDIVVDVNPTHLQGRTARVVVEAKCRRVSMKAALAELDQAMENRDAHTAILVFAGSDLAPLQGKSIRVCAGDRVLAVFDRETRDALPLEAACIIARAAACRKATEVDFELSAEHLDHHFRRLVEILEDAKTISRGVTTARKGVDQIDIAYAAMRQAAVSVIADIQEVLAGKPPRS
jgi:hypothetical protein